MLFNSTFVDRFWSKIDKSGDCWVWTGRCATARNGYGVVPMHGGRHLYAHRVSYELSNGPIPQGLFVCHHCDNPPCVRPDHLFLGTAADNMNDMITKGRAHHGERDTRAKLTNAQVLEIRERYASGQEPSRVIAAEYGVAPTTIRSIVNGHQWESVGGPLSTRKPRVK